MTSVRDWLFRIGMYRGFKVASPPGLVTCSLHRHTDCIVVFKTMVNDDHVLAEWLFEDCEGPWAVRMCRPLHQRRVYVAFARLADATSFHLMAA